MLQSFLVYGITSVLLIIFGSTAARRERIYSTHGFKTPFWTWEIIFSLLIFAIVSGIRWNVGVDHLAYLNNYQQYQTFGNFLLNKEPGFEFLTKTMASCNLHFSIYFGILAFIQIFFIYYAIRNERYLMPFIGAIIILGPEYLSWMNGIRQLIAACIFVFSIQFIKKRKLLHYIITILIAASFHKSAIFLVIFYFIPEKDYFKNKYLNLGLLALTLIIGSSPSWINSIDFLDNILKQIGYDWYAENLSLLLEDHRSSAIGPRRLSILLINAFIIWFSPQLKHRYKTTSFNTYFNFSFIGILLYNLLANTSHVFLRPLSYFTIFLALTSSYLLHFIWESNKNKLSIKFIIIFLIAISYTIFSVIADYGKGQMDWSNYKFFWDYV